jgi:hypothetical protein
VTIANCTPIEVTEYEGTVAESCLIGEPSQLNVIERSEPLGLNYGRPVIMKRFQAIDGGTIGEEVEKREAGTEALLNS